MHHFLCIDCVSPEIAAARLGPHIMQGSFPGKGIYRLKKKKKVGNRLCQTRLGNGPVAYSVYGSNMSA